MSEKLPYDKPTEVWWHEGDERFYDASLSDGWVGAQYMLVPIDQWRATQDILSDSVDPEAIDAIDSELCFHNARAEYLQNGIESMILNCDHPDELWDDLNLFMETYNKKFFDNDFIFSVYNEQPIINDAGNRKKSE